MKCRMSITHSKMVAQQNPRDVSDAEFNGESAGDKVLSLTPDIHEVISTLRAELMTSILNLQMPPPNDNKH